MITPMRGQVVVREIKNEYATIRGVYRLGGNPRDVKIHRGTVLAIGAPMLTTKGAEVPHGFGVGDVVLFSFVHNEAAFTYPWTDGKPATWVPQWAVSAVVDESLMLSGALPYEGSRAAFLANGIAEHDGRVCAACRYDVFAHLIHTDRRNERWICPTEVAVLPSRG